MRRVLSICLITAAFAVASQNLTAQAQATAAPAVVTYQTQAQAPRVYQAPGYYGTSWGVASYGTARTYTTFTSPYGAGYSYGYAPYGVLPGRYGVGLWRQAATAPGYYYWAPAGYTTYRKPFRARNAVPGPPMGAYAPAFGPGGVPPMMLGN